MAAQLASSGISAASSSLGIEAGEVFSIEGLLAYFVGAGFVSPQGFERLADLALLGFAVGGELQAHLGRFGMGGCSLAPLPASQGQGRQQGQQQSATQATHGANSDSPSCRATTHSTTQSARPGRPVATASATSTPCMPG